jgi:hypothetical protein
MQDTPNIITLKAPPYKGTHNHWLTRPLFVDVEFPAKFDGRQLYQPIFSLYGPVEGFIDAHQTFVDLRDPTGYKWAMAYLGSFEHWSILSQSSWFKPELEKWKAELDVLFTAEAVQRIREIAAADSAQALPASKYLAEKGWEKTRGRPSKAEMEGELKRQVQKLESYEEDQKRMLGLTVVTGGKS